MVACNITPDREIGIGACSDGEKIRAIREGISHDGRPLFPMMPYSNYRNLSDEELQALVASLNARPAGSVAAPDLRDRLKYGAYLVTLEGCADCQTQVNRGEPAPGRRFTGGREFHTPTVRNAIETHPGQPAKL